MTESDSKSEDVPTAAEVGGIDAVNPLTNTIISTTKVDIREGDELVRRVDHEDCVEQVRERERQRIKKLIEDKKNDVEDIGSSVNYTVSQNLFSELLEEIEG